jgi:hypothetical protein
LRVDGRVKAVGGDGLEVWQLERLVDDAHEPPNFNALAVTPQRARSDGPGRNRVARTSTPTNPTHRTQQNHPSS